MAAGDGATGIGASGFNFADPHRTTLREAENTVSSAHRRWLCHVFDRGAAALPWEGSVGSVGSGDSGGRVLIDTDRQWRLAGLTAWTAPAGATCERPGTYGPIGCSARLGQHTRWIAKTLATPR